MMCVADKYVVVCLESVTADFERDFLVKTITSSGKDIIEIDFNQLHHFAGNMLQVKNDKEQVYLVMSSQAYQSLSIEQIRKIESYNPIIHSDISTIESNGGGSARCMMAEVFLPLK